MTLQNRIPIFYLLEMQWPPGVTAGFALEHWNPCRTLYSIQSKKKEKVMGVRGPPSTHGWVQILLLRWTDSLLPNSLEEECIQSQGFRFLFAFLCRYGIFT
ncbi:uncharacterized protein LOC144612776 [Panthera onca]